MTEHECIHGEPRGPKYCALCRHRDAQLDLALTAAHEPDPRAAAAGEHVRAV